MNTLRYRKLIERIKRFIDDKEIIVIHGSRQVGKTSLLHYIIDNCLKNKIPSSNIFYFDLEDFVILDLHNQGPERVMEYIKSKGADLSYRIFFLIDEIQYLEHPSNFLKLFFDRYKDNVKLIVSGSSSFSIKKKFKDSLAGRILDFELFPLDFEEFLQFKDLRYNLISCLENVYNELLPLYEEYIIYGGYPAIVLENEIEKKEIKLKQIISTYIKRDIRDIASIRDIDKFNNLLRVLASQSSGLVNISELSNRIGISKNTMEDYIFILENTYIVKIVHPFHKNIRSELTKMPKIFFEDTGMLNLLINKFFSTIITGQLFETSIFSLLRKNIDVENIYFWRTNKAQEVDFVLNLPKKNKLIPIEIKINYLKKYLTNLKYFQEQYSLKEAYVCRLYKNEEKINENINVIFPWDIYRLIIQ